ncbi:MAG: META domain-containing protein [Gemmatimonadaceae bacterium]|nr:META domain-containing protein [Gemmatimonadaceae bacterium]
MPSRQSSVLTLTVASVVVALAACGPPGEPAPNSRAGRAADSAYVRSVFGPTWTLATINGAAAPLGSGGRPATLEFYSGAERRVNGFAGCNQWSSTWERRSADSLVFTAPVSTRMACSDGMALEQRFLGIIEQARRIAQRDSTLTLITLAGDSARFVAR